MKRKYIYFLFMIWIIGSIIIVIHMIQIDIESKIRQWMHIYNCNVGNIDYSLMNKKIEMNNIYINSDGNNSKIVGSIDSVIIYDVNRDAFNGDYGNLVSFAKKIDINGIVINKKYDNSMLNISINKLYGENLYINLATSARMMLESKNLNIFYAFIDRYHVDKLLFENAEVSISSLDREGASAQANSVISKIDTLIFPNGLGCMLEAEKAGSFSVKGEGGHIIKGENESISAKQFEIANIIMDRKTCSKYAELFKFEDKYKIIDIDMFLDILKKYGIPFEYINIENINYINTKLIDDINIKNLTWNFEKGSNIEASLSLEELQIRVDDNLLKEFAISNIIEKEFIQSPLTLDIFSTISFSHDSIDIESNNMLILNANIHELADIKILMELDTYEVDSISNVLDLYNALKKIKISSLNIEYEDNGLINIIFKSISNTRNIKIQDIKDEVITYAESIQKRNGVLGLVKSVNTMMENPGILNFSYIPEIEMPLFFSIDVLENGEIMLKARPGEK